MLRAFFELFQCDHSSDSTSALLKILPSYPPRVTEGEYYPVSIYFLSNSSYLFYRPGSISDNDQG